MHCWIAYLLWVAWWWLGFTGAAMVLVYSTSVLRRVNQPTSRVETIAASQLQNYWSWPRVLCIEVADHRFWVLQDELPAAQWSALQQFLKLNVPGQALGLRVSK